MALFEEPSAKLVAEVEERMEAWAEQVGIWWLFQMMTVVAQVMELVRATEGTWPTNGTGDQPERYPSTRGSPDPWSMRACTRARPTRAQVVERQTKVVELTRSGLTDDEIAAELGYANRSGVWKARQRALDAQLAESVHEHRTLEVMRLDALQDTLWDAAMAGERSAVNQIRRIIELRCRLLGLLSGKPGGKPDGPASVVLPSFWDHMGADHPEDWMSCRCPGFLGDVDESDNEWLKGA